METEELNADIEKGIMMGIGWMYAQACIMSEQKEEITVEEVSSLIEKAKKDFGMHCL